MKQLFNTRILAVLALGALIGLTSTTVLPAQPWVSIGPAAATGGQVEGITNLPVAGAIEALAAHPTNPNILYIGGVNGGIFKTVNATAASPTWTPQTDAQASLSIGALEFDPTDGTFNTLVAGVGRTSSFLGTGGAHTGILRTTNGGATWTPIAITGVNVEVSGIAARGATIVVAAEDSDVGFGDTGVYRSTNGGATWTKISGAGGTGLPIARAFDMASDPTSTTRLFVIVRNTGVAGASGIYRSDDTGATWTKISNAAQDALLNGSSADANLAVGKAGPTTPNVFSAICAAATGALSGVHRTGNAAAVTPVWTALDLPAPTIHPGGQCGTHLSLVADPTNSNLVYIGGDRQGSPFPNGVGAFNFSGRLFRINAALAGGSQAQSLTHCTAPLAGCGGVTSTTSNSSPHADSREMVFDANGNLIEVDDGGIYRRTNPTSIGDWFSLNGNIAVTEQHDMAHDSVANIAMSGNQDTGSMQQMTSAGTVWDSLSTADGGDVIVSENDPIAGQSTRYASFQNFGALRRRVYNAANVLQSTVFPTVTPLGGDPTPTAQFVGPLEANNVAAGRVIMGAANGTYESADRLDTVSRISLSVVNQFGRGPIDYGTAGNANALYFGSADDIQVRLGAPPTAPTVTDPDGASTDFIEGVVIDPDNASAAFAVDRDQVFRTTNAGTTWTNVTGNLGTLGPGRFRSIEYINAGGDRVVVGADTGVFVATEATGFSTWAELGTALPNVPVFDLDFDAGANQLLAGTMGRGTFRLGFGGGGCPATLTLATQTLVGTTNHDAVSVTLGPSLITTGTHTIDGTTISVLNGTTSLGGTTTLGNNPVCP